MNYFIMPPDEAAIARVGLTFADALVRQDWAAAHLMLASCLRDDWQPTDLQRQYESMTSYFDQPAKSVELGLCDSERAYVAIYSLSQTLGTCQEAVDVRVVEEDGRWLIDDIVWGRP